MTLRQKQEAEHGMAYTVLPVHRHEWKYKFTN